MYDDQLNWKSAVGCRWVKQHLRN